MLTNSKWTILLIDDEKDIRDVMSISLIDAGYTVFTAENGSDGIEKYDHLSPMIVISDICMPELDGLELLEAVKKRDCDTEFILISGFGEMDTAVKALQLDASDFITKPVSDVDLHLALKRAKERFCHRKKIKDYTHFLEQENVNQAKMLHRDKMISLGKLAAGVVHEINNPLAGILNYARLMQRILGRGEPSHEQKQKFNHYLDLIESETHRCSKIVSGLLNFSRNASPSLETVNIGDLLERSVLLSKHKLETGKVSILTDIPEELPEIKGDFNQLQQCMINLIFNAADAMPEGGAVEISAEAKRKEGLVLITVKDSGCGISDDDMSNIFEPFFTTKNEGHGVGLGLSIVYGIIEFHKGGIEVKQRTPKGTVFLINLPVNTDD